MTNELNAFLPYVLGVLGIIQLLIVVYLALGIVVITEDAIGVVTKKVSFGKHRNLPDGQIIALNGEAGIQADTLAPGWHLWYWKWQYTVRKEKFTGIPYGKIGVVEARDGKAITDGRVLGATVPCDSFQNARTFLMGGGSRGPQMAIIPPGVYRINKALFEVSLVNVTEIPDDQVGVVTTKDGRPLNTRAGEIAGPQVGNHNSFQDPYAFLTNDGTKGLQEQVLLAGRYFINPAFAEVELHPMTTVPIAHVGVVISYIGAEGKDVTGEGFKHGNLVSKNEKGVWAEPLDPGKYPINPLTHKVENVPTANVVLNWATGKTESHNLDKNLSTITARSSDGFTFNLDVSQIIHVSRNEAPKVIARFGTMMNMVTQVFEPLISNYFRNAAQGSDVIDFLKHRRERQQDARNQISSALSEYNVVAVDTLIGDIVPPQALMETLTQRKIAEQQQLTFTTQQAAEETRKNYMQAKATADTQPGVVTAERSVQIADFTAQATVKAAEGAAQSKIVEASAEAQRITLTGNAEASRTLAIGGAEATVIQQKIDSMESGNFAQIEVAKALANGTNQLVPEIMLGGSGEGGGVMGLLAVSLLKDSLETRKNGHIKSGVAEANN